MENLVVLPDGMDARKYPWTGHDLVQKLVIAKRWLRNRRKIG